MTKVELILQGISDGDTIGGPFAMASLVAKALADNPFDFDALDKAYRDYHESGSFDSGPTFERVHELMAKGYQRNDAVERTHKLFNKSTAGCNPMHRFMVVAGLDVPYELLDSLARKDAKMTHQDPVAGLMSSITVRIIRKVLNRYSLPDAITYVTSKLATSERKILQTTPSPSGFAPAVLNAAMKFSQDYDRGLIRAVDYAGSHNYCPPIVGAIIRCTTSNLPE